MSVAILSYICYTTFVLGQDTICIICVIYSDSNYADTVNGNFNVAKVYGNAFPNYYYSLSYCFVFNCIFWIWNKWINNCNAYIM